MIRKESTPNITAAAIPYNAAITTFQNVNDWMAIVASAKKTRLDAGATTQRVNQSKWYRSILKPLLLQFSFMMSIQG